MIALALMLTLLGEPLCGEERPLQGGVWMPVPCAERYLDAVVERDTLRAQGVDYAALDVVRVREIHTATVALGRTHDELGRMLGLLEVAEERVVELEHPPWYQSPFAFYIAGVGTVLVTGGVIALIVWGVNH